MSKKLSPAERLRTEIDQVFAGGEAEVAAFLGRDRYQRAASCVNARVGMRNGYCPTTVKTTRAGKARAPEAARHYTPR